MKDISASRTDPDHKPLPVPEEPGPADDDEPGDQDADAVPLYRRKRVVIPLAAVIIIAAVAAWYWYANVRGFDSTDDAFIDGYRVSISSKILGRVAWLGADEGDSVAAGQTLVRLEDADLRAQESQAKASMRDAEEGVGLARVNYDRAEADFRRARGLSESHALAAEEYDHARGALAAARAQLTIAQSRVGSARAQLGVVQTQLGSTAITAPMAGVVARRWALPGDVVQPGQPILTLNDLQNVWVTANFEETKLRTLHVGDAVEITVDAYPDRQLHGTVEQLGTATAGQFSLIPPNNASGNFTKVTQRVPVKIALGRQERAMGDPQHPLLPGMSAEVKVRVH